MAARVRAKYGFKTPDAIQLAGFEYSGCDYFITNDSSLKKYDQKKVIVLTELMQE